MNPVIHTISCMYLMFSVRGNTLSQGEPYKGSIKPYETQNIDFTGTSGLKRIVYFQCTGSADLAILDSTKNEIQTFTDFVTKSSGDCDETFACSVDPCSVSECPSAPKATCSSNYCVGCTAEYRVDSKPVQCFESSTGYDSVYSKGAPPHKSVIQMKDENYEFTLRGKRSTLDSVNTFQLYVFDNHLVDDTIISISDESKVLVRVEFRTIEIAWTAPVYGDPDVLKHYCLYYLEKNLEELLQGDWVACGHEIKKNAVPVKCVQSNTASFENVAPNKSHYIWVVAVSVNDIPTAYPFVRVDVVQSPLSRTIPLGYSIILLLINIFLGIQ